MFTVNATNAKFVVVRNINRGHVFWTSNDPACTPTDAFYEVLAYTLTCAEARAIMDSVQDPKAALIAHMSAYNHIVGDLSALADELLKRD